MIRLRPVTVADIPALGELGRRCDESHREWAGPDVGVPPPAEQETEWHARLVRAGAWAMAAVEGGQIVGACSFSAAREQHHDGALVPGLAHVSAVFVDPAHWRKGIARRLLVAAEEAMRDRGYEQARLWTLEGSPAERLYAAEGWTRTDERDLHPPTGLPVVRYVKALGTRA